MVSAHRHRPVARVLLVDHHDRVLLFLTTAPDSSGVARWLTPGGGVDPGETFEQGARRELAEETGLVVDELRGPVWTHDYDVVWDSADHDTGHAEFFVHVTEAFEPSTDGWTDDEKIDVLAHRWWSLDELVSERPRFEPPELLDLIRRELGSRD